jgi:polyhydroxybutyrate depolymerase
VQRGYHKLLTIREFRPLSRLFGRWHALRQHPPHFDFRLPSVESLLGLQHGIQRESGSEPYPISSGSKTVVMIKPSYSTLLVISLSIFLFSCGGGSGITTGTGGTGTGGTGGGPPCGTQAGTTCESLVNNGVTRTYALHVPANFQKNTSALVIVLHGTASTGLAIESTTKFSTLSDQVGFAVAYPDASVDPTTGQTDWAYFFNDFTNDVDFFRQLIGTLQMNVGPDPKKIFVTGHSSGAFMSHRLGAELSDLIAGIGAVEGAIYSTSTPTPIPPAVEPVSVLMLHGDQDQTVMYCGSNLDASQDESFNYWSGSSANSCTTVDVQSALCDIQGNISPVVEKKASSCSANTEVQFYKLVGGDHSWTTSPMNVQGQTPYNPAFDSTTGITTTDILWNFFSAHPKP